MSPPRDPRVPQFADAIQRIRETAKWLIAAFAAVGAALTASIPLTALGTAHGERLAIAIIGAALALVGIVVAILTVARVLTPVSVTLPELDQLIGADVIADDSLLLGVAPSLTALSQQYKENLKASQQAELKYHEGLRDGLNQHALDPLRLRKDFHDFRDRQLNQVLRNLRGLALYRLVATRFANARWGVITGAVLVLAGVLLFSYGTGAGGVKSRTDPRGKPGVPGRTGERGLQGYRGPRGFRGQPGKSYVCLSTCGGS